MSHITSKKFKQFSIVLLDDCGVLVVTLASLAALQFIACAPSLVVSTTTTSRISDYEFSTEPPELVETFNPSELVSRAAAGQQIEIQSLKLVTEVKLRYARTIVVIQLNNPSNKELQSDFKIVLPDNAFFTVFKLKRGKSPKIYNAEIQTKDRARNKFHYVRTKTNGTMVAGYIELSNSSNLDLSTYNLKFTLSPQENVQAYLVYETQLERKSNKFSNKIHVYPLNQLVGSPTIGTVKFSVNVEELEDIKSLQCAPETEQHFSNCSSKAKHKRKNGKRNLSNMELVWRQNNVTTRHMADYHFRFIYELEPQNDTTAVVISQHDGNFYFVHLFVPKNLPVMRKHIIFLLDVSDSMHGNKLDQLKWSMKEILDDLESPDFFNIIAFSNNLTEWSKYRGTTSKCPFPYPATEEFKDSAMYFIDNKLIAQGSTNIFLGLSRAFNLTQQFSPQTDLICSEMENIRPTENVRSQVNPKLPENVLSMIFFLSDGKATSGVIDSKILLDHFYQLNHNNSEIEPVQIHTIAYDQHADVGFLKALSTQNGGFTKVIKQTSAASLELTNFYAEVSSQIMSQVQTYITRTAANPFNTSSLSSSSSPLQISSPVTIIKGGEVLTTGMLSPPLAANQSFNSSQLTWSTEGIGKNGKLTYYNSPSYNCTSLDGLSLQKCADRIGFFLERLQAYQLLKKLLERDKLVQGRYICPKSMNDDFQDLKMQRLREYEEEKQEDKNKSCFNSFEQRSTEFALQHKFVTPYTSFILTTTDIDNGLHNNTATPSSQEDSYSDSMENEPRHKSSDFPTPFSAPSGRYREKIIFLQSLTLPASSSQSEHLIEADKSSNFQTTQLLVEEDQAVLSNIKEIGKLTEEQVPISRMLIRRNETEGGGGGSSSTGGYHQEDNSITTANNNNATIIIPTDNVTQQQQSKSFANYVRDFAKRFAKIVFKPSKITGDSNN